MDDQSKSNHLWGEFAGLMCHHQKPRDATPMEALNRLFGEYWKKGNNLPKITESNVTIQKEQWPVQKLKQVKRKDETTTSDKVKNSKCPVVVLAWNGDYYLIDGRRRINT